MSKLFIWFQHKPTVEALKKQEAKLIAELSAVRARITELTSEKQA